MLFVGDAITNKVMPVEFSTGAFRLMHSRARGRYRLNDLTDGSDGNPLVRFFDVGFDEPDLTGGSPLPDLLVIDWDRMFIDPDQDLNITEVARILVSSFLSHERASGVVEMGIVWWLERHGTIKNTFPPWC